MFMPMSMPGMLPIPGMLPGDGVGPMAIPGMFMPGMFSMPGMLPMAGAGVGVWLWSMGLANNNSRVQIGQPGTPATIVPLRLRLCPSLNSRILTLNDTPKSIIRKYLLPKFCTY